MVLRRTAAGRWRRRVASSVFRRRLLERRRRKRAYGPGTLPDRRPMGRSRELLRPADCGTRGWAPWLRGGSRNSSLFVACATAGTNTLHANCRTKNIGSARRYSRGRASLRWRRPHASIDHAAGEPPGSWNVPTATGSSMTKEAALNSFFSSVRVEHARQSTEINNACTQGQIEKWNGVEQCGQTNLAGIARIEVRCVGDLCGSLSPWMHSNSWRPMRTIGTPISL